MTINPETVLNNLPGCVIAVDENLLRFYSNQESGCRQKVVEPSLKYAIERAFNEKSGFDGIEVSAKRTLAPNQYSRNTAMLQADMWKPKLKQIRGGCGL